MLSAIVALGASSGALAQEFFDFGQIPGVPAEPNVEVNMNAAMLAFVAEAANETNPDAGHALDGLKAIRVRVYEKLDDPKAVARFLDDSSKTLDRQGWQRTVFVNDDEDKVRIYVKLHEQEISGMTVMVVDPEEAVFINIAGSINPTQLGRMARAMGMGDFLEVFSGLDDDHGARHRPPRKHDGDTDDKR